MIQRLIDEHSISNVEGCARTKDGKLIWVLAQIDSYISKHADMAFSYSICPPCYDRLVRPQLKGAKR